MLVIVNGIFRDVDTSTGLVIPAKFDDTSRCPDELVRRIRVTASYEDRRWNGKLLETYDTQTDTFKIAPCRWTEQQLLIARLERHISYGAAACLEENRRWRLVKNSAIEVGKEELNP
ncbi:hypothetical protein TIFTF001_024461 [Ficus carica]|uniref:Uncharacterized protein n=1 Tax=Ficus carica TaxID=3494 RepID=A0AA88AM42_FICCA|nr:hypothetical protein TIFTF001_024461 [Ficus carica]